ncbi:MAG: class I SAM-dependent methyltransferase [Thermomicrobiales bacterium]
MPDLNMTFNEVASLYHDVRPRYPSTLFDRIEAISGFDHRLDVLEIGSGTGIATRPMLERGWNLTCVEPGHSLADVARFALASFPDLRIDVDRFEDWDAQGVTFDLIVSATAFHWIKPDTRYTKTHRLLCEGGHLAVLYYRHVAGGDDDLFEIIQDCYLAHMPGTTREKMPVATKRSPSAREMRRSGLFDIVESSVRPEVITYSTSGYLDLLSTYSGHRALKPEQLLRLQSCIADVIDRNGGSIRKGYAHELVIGRRIEP